MLKFFHPDTNEEVKIRKPPSAVDSASSASPGSSVNQSVPVSPLPDALAYPSASAPKSQSDEQGSPGVVAPSQEARASHKGPKTTHNVDSTFVAKSDTVVPSDRWPGSTGDSQISDTRSSARESGALDLSSSDKAAVKQAASNTGKSEVDSELSTVEGGISHDTSGAAFSASLQAGGAASDGRRDLSLPTADDNPDAMNSAKSVTEDVETASISTSLRAQASEAASISSTVSSVDTSALESDRFLEKPETFPSSGSGVPSQDVSVGDSGVARGTSGETHSATQDGATDPKSDSDQRSGQTSPVHHEGPPTVEFGPDDRKRYGKDLFLALRPFVPAEKASEFKGIVVNAGLAKWQADALSTSDKRDDPRSYSQGAGRAFGLARRGGGRSMDHPDPHRGSNSAFPPYTTAGRPSSGSSSARSSGAGGYDAFDLLSARLRNPPLPTSNSAGGGHLGFPGRSGDPRGTGYLPPLSAVDMGSRLDFSRADGPSRQFMSPIDAAYNSPPVEKLVKGDNAWARKKEDDSEVEGIVKQVRSLLNKLTMEKFDKIFGQITDLDISSLEVLRGIVNEIFEKTLTEPMFAGMYAELCRRLNSHYEGSNAKYVDENGGQVTFRKVLLRNCQNEFKRFADSEGGDEASKSSQAEKDSLAAKKRMLANVRFIGELYKKDLLQENIIHKHCIHPLLTRSIKEKEEDVIEAVCNLLSRTGKKLSESSTLDAKAMMGKYFDPLQKLSKDRSLLSRTRFMLQDLIDLRNNGWNPRHDEQNAKTKSEVKADIEKEERAKELAQQAIRRSNASGGRRDVGFMRDRGPPSVPPRMTMQMPPAASRSSGGAASRSQSILDKYSMRSSSASSGSSSSAHAPTRLGPGSRGAGQWKWSGGLHGAPGNVGGPLRPGGGHRTGGVAMPAPSSASSNQFAALAQPDSLHDPRSDMRSLARSSGSMRSEPRRHGSRGMDRFIHRGDESSNKKTLPVLEPEALRRKTSAIIEEFWTNEDFEELSNCVKSEIGSSNAVQFVAETLKLCLDSCAANQEKTTPLFGRLVRRYISLKHMREGFNAVIAGLIDIEIDSPRAISVMSKYLAAMAASGSLSGHEEDDSMGLSFIRKSCPKIDDKRMQSKLVVYTFGALDKALSSSMDEMVRRAKVKAAYDYVGLDAVILAKEWNPFKGMETVKDFLLHENILYLVPNLIVYERLTEVLSSENIEAVVSFLKNAVPASDFYSTDLTNILMSLMLDWSLEEPRSHVHFSVRFANICASVLSACCIKENEETPDHNVQVALLMRAQWWVYEHREPILEGNIKAAEAIFHGLYDRDLVDEHTFIWWKEDTGPTTEFEGKPAMVKETSSFFHWLAVPDECSPFK